MSSEYESKIIYGNGVCVIEAEQIDVAVIRYKGKKIDIESTVGDDYLFIHKNNSIMITKIYNVDKYLNKLFIYKGDLRILSTELYNKDGDRMYPRVRYERSFTELIDSNTETMDRLTEEIGINLEYEKREVVPTTTNDNLNTIKHQTALYTEDGDEYIGDFHIHIQTSQVMSGKKHTYDSVNLYRAKEIKSNGSKGKNK